MSNPFASERLIYRAVEPEDEAFFEVIGKDIPGYLNSNYSIGKPQSKKRCNEYMKYVEETALLGVVFCITRSRTVEHDKSDDESIPIGCIHLSPIKPSQMHHRVSDIGIDVIPEYQGQGYGSEAIRWALHWAFEIAGLHRVKISAFEYNPGAMRLYTKLGFVLEGTFREEAWFRGKWYHVYWLALLDREWEALQDKSREVIAS